MRSLFLLFAMHGTLQPTDRKTPTVLVCTQGGQVVCCALPARLGPVAPDFATTALSTRICRTSAFSDRPGWTAHCSALSTKCFPTFGEKAKGYSVHEYEVDRRPGAARWTDTADAKILVKGWLGIALYLVE